MRVLRREGERSEKPVSVGQADLSEEVLCLLREQLPAVFAVSEFFPQDIKSE